MMIKRNAFALFGLVFAASAIAQVDSVRVPTRFGELKTNGEFLLTFKGGVIKPETEVVSRTRVLGTFKLESADVILVSLEGGAACPGRYAFVTVSSEGAKATPGFGTCYDDDVKPQQIDQSIAFSMPKVGGKGSVRYIYERGIVFENGKPLK